jgi:hypothetical protein
LCKPAGREGLGFRRRSSLEDPLSRRDPHRFGARFLFARSCAMILHLPEGLLPEMIPAAIAGR